MCTYRCKRRPDHLPQSRYEALPLKSIAVAIGWSPEGNGSYRDVNLRPTSDEAAALLDKVARKLGETMTFNVTMKHGAEYNPPIAIAMR